MTLPTTSSAYSHTHEMALYLTNTFAPAVVPQPDEYLAKESARVYLEKLADRVSPGAKLLPFGWVLESSLVYWEEAGADLDAIIVQVHGQWVRTQELGLVGSL